MNKSHSHQHPLLLLAWLGVVTACDAKRGDPTVAASTTTAQAAVGAVTGAGAKVNVASVSKLVFVVKEQACDCTRKKIDAAEAAIQQVLGDPSRLPVETLKADTQPEQVEPYRQQKPMMAIPAIYLVDANGSAIELLQGEITTEQLSKAVKSHGG
jgi:hypothetical protein